MVPLGGLTPPVVLLNGWQFSVLPPSSCPIATTGSAETFGSLATQLVAPAFYFFDNCVEQSVNGSSIEALGVTLGQFLNMVQYANGALVPQVDLVSHSMGGLIVRSYLAGLQANGGLSPLLNPRVRKFIEIATPNFGSFLAADYSDLLANGTQAAEMVPGSAFLWSLGTWNQHGDDLRGVDALAIIGNAGYWKSSIFASPQLLNASDGVVSLTSASLNFARDPSRTRILSYCHIGPDSGAYGYIDCTGKGGIANVDEAPETGQIILSFLAGTTAWQSVGFSNQTQFGGSYFALDNAAGTQYTPFSSVLLGSQAFQAGWLNTIFYNEFVSPGTGTFTETSTTNQQSTCGPFSVTGGTFSIFRCKFSPVISSVGPLLQNVPGWVVKTDGSITISGVGFGQPCSLCQVVAYPGPITLQVSSWSDTAISALLPSSFNGIAEVVVQAASGSDSITFMAALPVNCTYALNAGGQAFTAQGGDGAIKITTGPGCPWTVGNLPAWVTLTSVGSGVGSGTVTFQVFPTGGGDLSGSFTIAGLSFTVEQQATSIPGLSFIGSMAHLAAEENWTTTFTLVNKGTASETARLSLFGDAIDPTGNGPLILPLMFPQQPPSSGPLLAASFDQTLAANASLIVTTAGPQTPPVLVGSAPLAATGPVDGFAIFHQIVTAQEAVVPMETRNASSYLLAYDNTGGVALGVAVENVSAQAGTIGVVIRDDTGAQIGTSSIPMSANGHASFVLSTQYAMTANIRGTIEFDTPAGGQISVLGIRFTPPNNALTTIPALANVGTNGGSIAHLASGGDGWETTFALVNVGTSAAQATLSFFADQTGAPLPLPLSFPQGNATATTASSVSQTLAAGATLLVQSSGAPQLLTGSAQLSTTGQVSGFVIFRHNNQEAVVPLESRNANAYILAFDNTNSTATGIAINSVSTQAVNVPVIVRDDTGAQIATDTLNLAPNGHLAFTLGTQKYPATANIRGTIEFDKPANGQIGALGIRIPRTQTYTTLPALAIP